MWNDEDDLEAVHGRRAARVLAMQALCLNESEDEDPETLTAGFLDEQEGEGTQREYALQLVQDYRSSSAVIDDRIAAASVKWDLSRISMVERNIMRVAVVELVNRLVPPKVAITEAVEIGRNYGGGDSPRFINGVLDAVWSALESRNATS